MMRMRFLLAFELHFGSLDGRIDYLWSLVHSKSREEVYEYSISISLFVPYLTDTLISLCSVSPPRSASPIK